MFNDPRLEKIAGRLAAGKRLQRKEGIILLETDDLLALGRMADEINRARNGNKVYYINNIHINYTNICANRCRFCAYRKDSLKNKGAFFLSPEEILAKARGCWHEKVREFHIVGGCHPEARLDYYCRMLSLLSREFPGVHLQAFTAIEIEYIARKENLPVRAVLSRLAECGLGSLPGGGGEIFAQSVRKKICPEKISGREYLEVMREAHRMNIPTNVTMLFGHIESPEDRVDHLLAIRALQDETGGFNSFIPLVFHPQNTQFANLRKSGGIEILKTIAVSRLLLDNFDHVKSFWIMLGLPLTQVSLYFGADDVDGTVLEEHITHDAGAETPQYMPEEKLVRLIQEAGRIPVERDTLYRPVAERKQIDFSGTYSNSYQ